MKKFSFLTKSRWVVTIIVLFTLCVNNAWGAAGDVIKEFDCNVSAASTYARYTPTCDGVTWNVSWGQTSYIGTNKSSNYGNLKITNSTDLNAGKAVNASITTTTQGYCAIIPQSTMANVGKITISCSALSGSPAVYVVSSTSLSTAYTQITLKTGSGLAAQGATMTTSGLTFEFDKKTSGTYYAIVLYSASWYRLTSTDIQFIEGAAAAASHTLSSAVTPAASGSVSLSATSVAEGSTATATATPAAHYTFTSWSISGTGASLSSTTTNPTTVTMGTANATVTATFTAVPKASITLSEDGATSTDATTYYVGDTYTLPTTSSASCGTKVLVGWSTVTVAETNTKPTSNYYEKGAEVTLAASQTYYAVFATASGSGTSNATKVFSGENTADYQFTTGSDSEGGSLASIADIEAGKIAISFSKGSASNWPYYDGSLVRMYKNSTFSITPSSATITRVEVVRSSSASSNGGTLSVSGLTASGSNTTTNTNVFTGSATSNVTFSNDAQCRFSSISVTYSYSSTTHSAYSTSCVAPTTYNVTYNANGDGAGGSTGTTGSVPTDATDYSSGATVTVSGNGTLAKPGHTFAGWNTAANGTSTSYAAGATFSITTNTTLYAQWTPINYAVNWYVGGAAGDNKLTTGSQSSNADYGTNVSDLTFPTSSQTAIDCGDKTFVGWTNTSSYTYPSSPLFTKATAIGTIDGITNFYAVFAEDGGDDLDLVTNVSQLHEGDVVTIASFKGNESSGYVIKAYNDGNNWPLTSAETDGSGKIDGNTTDMQTFTLEAGTTDGTWAFYDGTGYPYAASTSKNYMKRETTLTANSSFEITIDGTSSAATVTAQGSNTHNIIRYNNSNSLFSCYESGQDDIYLYRKPDATGHTIYCESCDEVTMSISSVSNGTMTVKRNGKALANGDGVPTCSEQTLTVRVTPDAASHYWLSAMSISGVTGVTTDPSTTSSLPTKEVKEYSVTIPKDATGTLTITPTIEAIPQKTISFLVNGDDAEDNSPQDVYVGEKPELPTAPAENTLSCATRFVGWSTHELTETGNDAPDDLFSSDDDSPAVSTNATYHAVFASNAILYDDELTIETTGVTSGSSSYSAWSDKEGTYDAVYAGNSAGGNSSIQLRDNSNSGIVTTASGGRAKKVTLDWESHTTSGRTIDVYGKNTAYSSTADLYGENKGTKIGSIVEGTSTELVITGNYTYIGLRSNSGALYLNSVTIKWDDCNFKDYMTYCTKVFTDADAANHNWSTAGNWSGGVPTIKDRARIQKPVTVDVPTAKAKNVVLDQSGSPAKTGQLILDAGKELVVAETVRKTTDGSNYTATGEYDIIFNSTSSAGLGALVMGTHDGTNKATVNFYTKSYVDNDNRKNSRNQYVGTPFGNEPTMLSQFYNSWMYKITRNGSGVPGWTRIGGDDKLNAFEGYSVVSADATAASPGHTYWMQGELIESTTKVLDLYYSSSGDDNNEANENILANSWMAPIKIAELGEYAAFNNVVQTIYIFNAGSVNDVASADDPAANASTAGQWIALPVAAAPWVGIEVIPAMQSFSVYSSGASPSLTLDYAKLVYDPAKDGDADVIANRAPRRSAATENAPEVLRLNVRGESGFGDEVLLLAREDFSEGFDNGWDGRKLAGKNFAPQMYAVSADGNMSVNCAPEMEGTVIGFRKGSEDIAYTFTFEYDGENVWYLNDLKEQASTRINTNESYMFVASAEDMAARFVISATPIRNTPTAVENGGADPASVHKLMIDGTLYIIREGQMYSAEGVMIK